MSERAVAAVLALGLTTLLGSCVDPTCPTSTSVYEGRCSTLEARVLAGSRVLVDLDAEGPREVSRALGYLADRVTVRVTPPNRQVTVSANGLSQTLVNGEVKIPIVPGGSQDLRIQLDGLDYRIALTRGSAAQVVQRDRLKEAPVVAGASFGDAISISGDLVALGTSACEGEVARLDEEDRRRGRVYIYRVMPDDTLAREATLMADNGDVVDCFGKAVVLQGNTLLVGAPDEQSGNSTDPNNNALTSAGAAYVFTLDGETWTQREYLKAPAPQSFDNFGETVAMDGDTLAVGGSGAIPTGGGETHGKVHVFSRSNDRWVLGQTLEGTSDSKDNFGQYVAIEDDTMVVGAICEPKADLGNVSNADCLQGEGAAYVYGRSGSQWTFQQKLFASDAPNPQQFGLRIALNGDVMAISAPLRQEATDGRPLPGGVFVFERTGSTWTETQKLRPFVLEGGGIFGSHLALTSDVLAIASRGFEAARGAIYLYQRMGVGWAELDTILDIVPTQPDICGGPQYHRVDDLFGDPFALSGDLMVIGAPDEDRNNDDMESIDCRFDADGLAYTDIVNNVTTNLVDEDGTVDCCDFIEDNQSGFGVCAQSRDCAAGTVLPAACLCCGPDFMDRPTGCGFDDSGTVYVFR